jgi:hypothetical protein
MRPSPTTLARRRSAIGEIGAQLDRALQEHVVQLGAGTLGLDVHHHPYAPFERSFDIQFLGTEEGHLTGLRLRDLPLTPEKLREAALT